MHKESALTKAQKEEIRNNNMRNRDIFEYNNLGKFRKSYPNNDHVSYFPIQYPILTHICQDLQTKFEAIHEAAVDIWNEGNGTKPRNDLINYPHFQGAGGGGFPRTNPIGNMKAKAFDLVSGYQ